MTAIGEYFNSVQAAIMEVTLEFTPGEDNMYSTLFTTVSLIRKICTWFCVVIKD